MEKQELIDKTLKVIKGLESAKTAMTLLEKEVPWELKEIVGKINGTYDIIQDFLEKGILDYLIKEK